MWSMLGILAGEVGLIEDLAFSTGDQTRMAIDAGDQTMTISGHWESWERPELGSDTVGWHLRWTLESNNSFRVALFDQEIGPVASMDTFVVDKASIAFLGMGLPMGTLNVMGRALVAVWINSKLVFASRSTDWSQICFTFSTLNSPVVVAMVMGSALSVEEKTILALFHSQGAVGAQEEQVTGLWMGVSLYSMLFGASWGILDQNSS